MENLFIPKTNKTPEVNFQLDGSMTMTGVSIPENVLSFYQPIIDWLQNFESENLNSVCLTLTLDYLNTSSLRILLDILEIIDNYKNKGATIKFIWKYEADDDDLLELGQDIELSGRIKFEYETY